MKTIHLRVLREKELSISGIFNFCSSEWFLRSYITFRTFKRNLVGTPNSLDEPSGHMSPRRFVSLEEGRQSPDAEDKDTEYINLLSIALKVPKVESDNR